MTTGRHVAIYSRISQDRDGERRAVRRQRDECSQLVERLVASGALPPGLRVEFYEDNDVSAYQSGKQRPEFERLLRDAEAGQVEAVVSYHSDRLYRRVPDLYSVAAAVAHQPHLTVHTVKSGLIDFSTAAGRLAAGMLTLIATYEVEIKSDRQRSESDAIAAAGLPRKGGRRAFGYDHDGVTVREAEAAQVREGVARLLAGGSVMSIIRDWNENGLPPVTGGRWTHSSFQALMLRLRNAGIRQHRGEAYGPAAWPAIVATSDFEAVAALLTDTARLTAPDKTRKHLLSFILKCGRCGGMMRAAGSKSRGRHYSNYQCPGLNGCRLAIQYDIAEHVVKAHIASRLALPDPALLKATKQGRTELAALRAKRAQLASDERIISESDISVAMKVKNLELVHHERRQIDDQIQSIERRLALAGLVLSPVGPQGRVRYKRKGRMDVDAIADDLRDAMERFEAMDLATRRGIVKALCSVTVMPGQRGVNYKDGRSSYRRVMVQPLSPMTGEPIGEPTPGDPPLALVAD